MTDHLLARDSETGQLRETAFPGVTITQSSHGFAVGNVLYRASGSYAKAKADDTATSNVVGIISAVADVDNFTLTTEGYITGLSSLTDNTVYYLSDATAGALTATEPSTTDHVRKPLLIADSTTSGYFHICEGSIVGAGVSLHASSHADGQPDEIDVTDLAGLPLPIASGGTGETTAQAAIDALTDAAGATEGDVLTVDADGHAVFEAPVGGSGSGIFDCGTPTAYTTGTPLIDCGGI